MRGGRAKMKCYGDYGLASQSPARVRAKEQEAKGRAQEGIFRAAEHVLEHEISQLKKDLEKARGRLFIRPEPYGTKKNFVQVLYLIDEETLESLKATEAERYLEDTAHFITRHLKSWLAHGGSKHRLNDQYLHGV
jgi:hypothetical protein